VPTVTVNLANHRYDVHVDRGLIPRAGEIIRSLTKSKKIGIVTDKSIAPHFLSPLAASLRSASFEVVECILEAGETHKHLGSISTIFDAFLSNKWERSNPIIALGGGVIGDMTGYAAASILRGVPFVQMPTTLLSMVDASVGGKTGINHAAGKNLIGAFHQPIVVLADIDTLKTLPTREFVSGLAECIKHEIIRDARGFDALEESIGRALALDAGYLTQLVAHNVAIKARVVEVDPHEHGERAHLNFGHTFGHGIERASNYRLLHGECVALGIIAASRTALELGMIEADSVLRIEQIIAASGLPTGGLKEPTDSILTAMHSDKKVRDAKLRFVLPDRIGHVVIRDDVSDELVRGAIESLR
jgi:3-dehydroquinate synthase